MLPWLKNALRNLSPDALIMLRSYRLDNYFQRSDVLAILTTVGNLYKERKLFVVLYVKLLNFFP
jgi:hypothetical protein